MKIKLKLLMTDFSMLMEGSNLATFITSKEFKTSYT